VKQLEAFATTLSRSRLACRYLINIGLATVAALALGSSQVGAEAWPSRPIKIVCAFPAGGATDAFARVYGESLSEKLGQPVVVENHAGATGTIAAAMVKAAPPDGYTLLFGITAMLAQNRVMFKNLPYDPDKDFVLISSMSTGHTLFVAGKATGARTLSEFVEHARKNPTNMGTWGVGTYAHIVIAALNKEFGLDIKPVHYRGEAPMWQDLAAGVLQGAMGSYPNGINAVEAGAGRVIAVTKRSAKLPGVPTLVEQGLKSKVFALSAYFFLAGPAGIPQDVVERLSALMVEAGTTERVRKLLDSFGIDEAPQGHIAFKKLYDSETSTWVDAARALDLAPQ
jgi:tripartite-type tricarboxylate transporter receptor subunit TctC